MDNYTNNNIDELTLMRSQMEELKAKLDREVRINEASIRKLQKRNMSFINKYLVFAWCALPLIVLMFVGFKYFFDLSWAVTLVMIAGCAVDIYFDTRFNRMKDAYIESMTLVAMSERLLWMKRMRRKQFVIGMPLMTIWTVWFAVELFLSLGSGPAAQFPGVTQGALVGGIIGSVIGGFVGYWIYRKMQHDSDDVIEQIRSLRE